MTSPPVGGSMSGSTGGGDMNARPWMCLWISCWVGGMPVAAKALEPLRPPAVPLVTIDPYTSVWSFSDRLYDSWPKHWTGAVHAMTGMIRVDGKAMRFMGADPLCSEYGKADQSDRAANADDLRVRGRRCGTDADLHHRAAPGRSRFAVLPGDVSDGPGLGRKMPRNMGCSCTSTRRRSGRSTSPGRRSSGSG